MAVSRRLLVLAMDAASPDLLRAWTADGTLPNLATLMAQGVVGDTASLEGHYFGSPWPSFYTGTNAGRHGFSWLDRLKTGTYALRPTVPSDFTTEATLWDALRDAGRRSLVMDVPLCSLSQDISGVQVLEWRSHDSIFGFQTTPPSLKWSILGRNYRHPAPARCDVPSRTGAQYRAFARALVDGCAERAHLTRRLLAEHQWDFAIQVFSESHCGGHQLWHFHDPAHPGYDNAETRECGDLIRDVYVALDAAIGEVLASLDPDVTVVVLTLHSMSYMAGVSLLLPEILTRLGVTCPARSQPGASAAPRGNRITRGVKAAYQRIPARVRAPLYDLRTMLRQRWIDPSIPLPIDPGHSRCFRLALGPTIGGIRLNLRGREPIGTLSPGPEADQFCEQITRELMELINPDTGQPTVTRVLRTADHFHGSRLGELPDLLVEWNLEQPLGNTVVANGVGARVRCYSDRTGMIEGVNTYGRTGEHRMGGLFIARGPGVAPGQFDHVVSNLDLAPTFARFLGADMASADGRPVAHLLES